MQVFTRYDLQIFSSSLSFFSFLLLAVSSVQQKVFVLFCFVFNFGEVSVYQLVPLWIVLLVLYRSIFSCFLPEVLGFIYISLQIDIHLFWPICQGDQLCAPESALCSCGKPVVSVNCSSTPRLCPVPLVTLSFCRHHGFLTAVIL